MNKEIVLLLTIGGTPDPIIKSLETHDPDFIYFIPSAETQNDIPALLQRAFPDGCHAGQKIFTIENKDDLGGSFRACYDAFQHIRALGLDRKKIIADPTGGTKIMSAALLLAALDMGVEVSYVAGEKRSKEGKGIVLNGTENVVYSGHPYHLMARADKEDFCANFNSYRFESAIANCNHIISKTGELPQKIFQAFKSACQGYLEWDLFQFEKSKSSLENSLEQYQRLAGRNHDDLSMPHRFTRCIADNLSYLKSLNYKSPSLGMVSELMANACRRAEEGRYDDAVARLYRALELISQWRFSELFGFGTSKFRIGILDEKSTEEPKDAYRKQLWPGCGPECEKDVAMFQAFKILAHFGDEYGIKFEEKYHSDFKKLLSARNNSILAHGVSPIKRDTFESLYAMFKGLFNIEVPVDSFPKIKIESLMLIGS